MVPAPCARMVPVPPPADPRAQAKVGPALLLWDGDALYIVLTLDVDADADRITGPRFVLNPDKLRHIARQLERGEHRQGS